MKTAVPSPNGSNLERLFFSKVPVALDAAPDDQTSLISAMAILVAQMSNEEKEVCRQMLANSATAADPDDDDTAMDSSGRTWADRRYAAGLMTANDYYRNKKYYGGAKPSMDQIMKSDPDYGKSLFERFPGLNRLVR